MCAQLTTLWPYEQETALQSNQFDVDTSRYDAQDIATIQTFKPASSVGGLSSSGSPCANRGVAECQISEF